VPELHWLGLAESADLIRRKEISPVELATALLERIQAFDGALHAFLTLRPEMVLADARRAEAAVTSGQALGPLHGVCLALKDIIDAAGYPTTCHSSLLAGNVAAQDAGVTRRLKDAGGIVIGKAATHEFAYGGPSFDLPWPPARNPWDTRLSPGGSSSGPAAAVAAGFTAGAIGSDTGGSIRSPAASCGLVGMKPSFGSVGREGVFPLADSFDTVGPLTRTVHDNALLLGVMADRPNAELAEAAARSADSGSLSGLRIGLITHFHATDLQADAETTAALAAAASKLTDLGAEVIEVATAPLAEFGAQLRVLVGAEAAATHRAWMASRSQDYGALTRRRLETGLQISAVDYIGAQARRRELIEQMNGLMRSIDVVAAANSMDLPFPIDDPAAAERFQSRQARGPFSLTGHPALALPIGFSAAGLPVSMQLAAGFGGEAMIYRVAAAYEAATGWSSRHPDLREGQPRSLSASSASDMSAT
jgi:aspartyl-tRNA(Asn)/glutamyl-tRNA(Gln) amidotransferase subunit A